MIPVPLLFVRIVLHAAIYVRPRRTRCGQRIRRKTPPLYIFTISSPTTAFIQRMGSEQIAHRSATSSIHKAFLSLHRTDGLANSKVEFDTSTNEAA